MFNKKAFIYKGFRVSLLGSNPPLLIIKTIKVTKAILLARRKYKIAVDKRPRGAAYKTQFNIVNRIKM